MADTCSGLKGELTGRLISSMIDSVGFNLWRVSLDPEFFNPNHYLCQAFFSAGFGFGGFPGGVGGFAR
jgi:hypothetical protein